MLWLLAYIGTIFAANYSIQHWGVVNVGFGLVAPAGVYWAGAALTCRDFTQDALGRRWVIIAILLGACCSWWIAPSFALASGTAFLVSELADFAIYTPLRARHWLGAVALSNTVGAVLDSLIFLWLAFGSLEFFWGQVVGKTWVTLLAVALLGTYRAIRENRKEAYA